MSAFHPKRTLGPRPASLRPLMSKPIKLPCHTQEERCFRLADIGECFPPAVFSLFFKEHLRHRISDGMKRPCRSGSSGCGGPLVTLRQAGVRGAAKDRFTADR